MPDGSPPGSGARDALRISTEAVHLRLHGIPVFRRLAEGGITRAEYAALLSRKLGFHEALEARLAEAPSLAAYGLEVAERRRTHLLRADLAWLCGELCGARAPLPPFATAAEALGGLYVAEGSTLGGRQLARALDALLPPGDDGRRFLLGYGARHGEMWRQCCAAIEACGAESHARAEMIAGAERVFAAFEAWFAEATPTGAQPVAASSPLPP